MIEISCKQFRYLASPPYFFRLRHVALWPAFFFRLCHVALWAAIFDSNPSVNWLHPVGRGRKREVLQLFPTVLGAVTNCFIFVPNCFCCCSQLFLQLFPTIFAVVPNSFCCCSQLFLLLFLTVFAVTPNYFCCCYQLFLLLFPTVFAVVPNCFCYCSQLFLVSPSGHKNRWF